MMWIKGYNDGVESLNNNLQDHHPLSNGRRNDQHRPLMPARRPPAITAFESSSAQSLFNPTITTNNDHLLALNHYHLAMAEHNRRGLSNTTQHVVVSSRWNPTPEQLQTLEEIYRRGTRTPSGEQIQQITSQLRRYGKIEGKNVFYWFQNHKARDRQKRRRRQLAESSSEYEHQPPQNNHIHTGGGTEENGNEKRESIPGVMNRKSYEVEQTTKNRPSNSITTADKKTLSAEGTTSKAAEGKSDHGWAQYDIDEDAESLHRRRNATWQAMQLSSYYNSSSPTNLQLINSCSVATTVTANNPSAAVLRPAPSSTDIITSSKQIQDSMVSNLFFAPYYENAHGNNLDDDDDHPQGKTLQLFPPRCDNGEEESGPCFAISPNNYQFFEFLPLKN